jgi:hypothetical protein
MTARDPKTMMASVEPTREQADNQGGPMRPLSLIGFPCAAPIMARSTAPKRGRRYDRSLDPPSTSIPRPHQPRSPRARSPGPATCGRSPDTRVRTLDRSGARPGPEDAFATSRSSDREGPLKIARSSEIALDSAERFLPCHPERSRGIWVAAPAAHPSFDRNSSSAIPPLKWGRSAIAAAVESPP